MLEKSLSPFWMNTAWMWPGSDVTLPLNMDRSVSEGLRRWTENSPHIQAAAYSTSAAEFVLTPADPMSK